MNVVWHQQHRLPFNPTLDQRVAWHIAHASQCACREMPAKIKAEVERRESIKTAPPPAK